ncbi:MAG: UDP-galactopyranose mutase [Bacteroidota bacterium]
MVVGAGLYGAVFANRLHRHGLKCLVIEKRHHPGGNVYCENVEGINVHKYGPHIFHTNNKQIWKFVNDFTEFNRFTYSPLANYNGELFSLPFNMNTFRQLWGIKTPDEALQMIKKQRKPFRKTTPKNLEEQALSLVGKDIYETLIKGYTEKQWGCKATEVPAFIIKRLPLRLTFDNNYFNDRFQGIPVEGYNNIIKSLLKDIPIKTSVNYFEDRHYFNSVVQNILFTGCIDEFFDYEFGQLDYRSLRFETQFLEKENYQGVAAVNFTNREVPFSRIIEHKHFEFGKQPHTIITKEFPESFNHNNEPFYPVNDSKNNCLFEKYKKKAASFPKLHFGGRLGHYKYYNMDEVIEKALEHANQAIITNAEKANPFNLN